MCGGGRGVVGGWDGKGVAALLLVNQYDDWRVYSKHITVVFTI